MVLLAFALGWALLAVLSIWFSTQPQRWAAAPPAFMAVASLISLLPPGSVVQDVFGWVWPPVLFGLVVWMIIRIRRQLRSRGVRWLLYPVLAVLMVASVGGGYETVREYLDARAYRMPGQLVDVSGHRMHLYCTGSGSPTVILEPGQGGASSDLGWVAPAVARDSTVCVYDRAGCWTQPAHHIGLVDICHISMGARSDQLLSMVAWELPSWCSISAPPWRRSADAKRSERTICRPEYKSAPATAPRDQGGHGHRRASNSRRTPNR